MMQTNRSVRKETARSVNKNGESAKVRAWKIAMKGLAEIVTGLDAGQCRERSSKGVCTERNDAWYDHAKYAVIPLQTLCLMWIGSFYRESLEILTKIVRES